MTRHRATCGLPSKYLSSSISRWRDPESPLDILTAACSRRRWPKPIVRGEPVEETVAILDPSPSHPTPAEDTDESTCLLSIDTEKPQAVAEMPQCESPKVVVDVESESARFSPSTWVDAEAGEGTQKPLMSQSFNVSINPDRQSLLQAGGL